MTTNEQLVYISAMFIGSSVAGWALLLWEDKPVSRKQALGGVLLSGFSGVIVSLLLYKYLQDNPMLLAGVSLLAGVGGASTLEFLAVMFRKYVREKLKKAE